MRSGNAKILIGTEILAHGIDIPNARICIIYHLRRSDGIPIKKVYHDMAGRVGRFGKEAIVIRLSHDEADDSELPRAEKINFT